MTNEISQIVLTQIESVLVADADPQEALDKAQAEVEALMARSQ
jgi:ABC-type glycerol-3-phosphate transport system substrate-binding protein